MITLPAKLQNFMQGQNLEGLKPFAYLFRNKWNSSTSKFALESTPVDISNMLVKPNTLSMTLDVNEVAQYNTNNVTLTLSDPQNRFVEGTPKSYFPDGYQLYGSRVVLYYGLDSTSRTALFTGVIKDLPTHKPEQYQVDVKLVSPLEMLKDIEAKDFSNAVTGETLTRDHTDDDGNPVYRTSGMGVGGFNTVYANGVKIYEGVDYKVSQTSEFGLPALITIINSNYYSSIIKADYYTWKTDLSVEQIITGLAALGGYNNATEDIRTVIWNTEVRTQRVTSLVASVGYAQSGTNLIARNNFNNNVFSASGYKYLRHSHLPNNFTINLNARLTNNWMTSLSASARTYFIGKLNNSNAYLNGVAVIFEGPSAFEDEPTGYYEIYRAVAYKCVNGSLGSGTVVFTGRFGSGSTTNTRNISVSITREGDKITVSGGTSTVAYTFSSVDFGNNDEYNEFVIGGSYMQFDAFALTETSSQAIIRNGFLIENPNDTEQVWGRLTGALSDSDAQYTMQRRSYNVGWTAWSDYDFNNTLGITATKMQFVLNATSGNPNFAGVYLEYLSQSLLLNLVNLSNRTVLEALQDFALISGYEFGVDRNGIFFFRPRVQSTTPVYVLDHSELVKVDTVKKNLSDFFTKLTLKFAEIPLEFYANTGTRPTPIDRYGVINKEIDKPDIVNYDNPELAQAIGPQLLEAYETLPNIIQGTGKLNLALELGDVVSLRREMPLTINPTRTDYTKYEGLDTYYKACKITGLNYNFSKKQITYTLRDVSNKNTEPQLEYYEYQTEFPTPLDIKR